MGGRSRKPVKQHICCFYWLTRGGEVAAGGVLRETVFGTQTLCTRWGSMLGTQTLSGGGMVRFYLHKLFGWLHG